MTKRIRLVLPCHSLEDFPTHHEGDDAEGLLANWTAMWHPQLIAHSGESPVWWRFDEIPEELSDTIVLMPTVAASYVATDLEDTVQRAGGTWIADQTEQPAIIQHLRDACGLPPCEIDDDLVNDFLAFGYWYLQIELLTRQMRYTSNLDQDAIQENTLAAANAADNGDESRARELLQRGFTRLAEERDHYYPVDAYCLDLTLVSDRTKLVSLEREWHEDAATNLWITGQSLETQVERSAALVESIRQRIKTDSASVGVVGGEYRESPLALESRESIRRQFERGRTVFESTLGIKPTVFFRRRFGLSPSLPAMLKAEGYVGVVHATLDAGWFPECSQARTQWQAEKGACLEAIGCIPLDATKPETFLKLSLHMGQSMEMDYVATICLAHWAGTASHWYDAMRRGIKFGLRMGKQTTFDEYFENTTFTSAQDTFVLDQYRSPYLNQSVAADEVDPISSHVRRRRKLDQLSAARRFAAWHAALDHDGAELLSLWTSIQSLTDPFDSGVVADEPSESELLKLYQRAASSLASCLTQQQTADEQAASLGTLTVNAGSAVRRSNLLNVDVDSKLATEKDFVYATNKMNDQSATIVDLPMSGFAWLPDPSGETSTAPGDLSEEAELVDGMTLRNEFLRATIDEESGGLGGLYDFATRGNRLSQRLSTGPDTSAPRMVASGIRMVQSSHVYGEIQTSGTLLDSNEQPIAEFTQKFSLWRGSRILRIGIELTPTKMPVGKPWKDYVGCRWAWNKDDDQLYRCIHGIRYSTEARRCEIPDYLEIENGKRRTFVLTGGLPFHTKVGERTLDSLLLVSGESSRRFEFGVGVDLKQPFQAATDFWLPEVSIAGLPCPANDHGLLFHINARYVVAEGWELIWEDGVDHPRCVGLRIRLFESSGRACDATIRCPFVVKQASKADFSGEGRDQLSNDGISKERGGDPDKRSFRVPLGPYEWTEVEVHW